MLIFYAGKYVNAVTAEDLVQDVFLKVWQKRTFLFLKEGIKTYLYRSVQHACLDYLKHQEVKGDYINAVTTKHQLTFFAFLIQKRFYFFNLIGRQKLSMDFINVKLFANLFSNTC